VPGVETRRSLRFNSHSPYRRLIGVGGIGAGIFFALEGNHTLGRNESRPARLLDIRDYCKLHIIAHYVAVLLGADPSGVPFHVVPVGKVGDDEPGHRMLREMSCAGMDVRRVQIVKDRPTLFSVCFQYPSGEGGNLTTTQSAAAELTAEDVAQVSSLFAADGIRSLALVAPEVSLEARYRVLELATGSHAFRAAALTSSEMLTARRQGFFSLVDLVSINEDEAGALTGRVFDPADPFPFLHACSDVLISCQPSMRIVVSAGKHGAFAFADGVWDHCPAAPASVVGTAGAGDALLAAILSGLAVGMPLISPGPPRRSISERPLASLLDFAVLLASFTVTSPHTIHPDAKLETLLRFAADIGVTFSDSISRYL
jgi:ribokinase